MVTSLLTYTSRRLYDVARKILGKVAKFGGPNLNGFEVIQFFSEGGCLNRAKHGGNTLLSIKQINTQFCLCFVKVSSKCIVGTTVGPAPAIVSYKS